MAIKTVYKTTDGQEFDTKAKAESHEAIVTGNDKLKDEVIEILNKIAVKLSGKSFEGYSQTAVYLRSVQNIVDELVNGDSSSASQYVENYYNSSQDC